ncbi:hypothetical protein K491DRAFT_682785 [Lophiostoma macrostomum CBS 122681]|uniref:Integral membrane protein n=1 Tax=Lophiostoma macrostomum CBS 122681 TaxID=1314788 RepID=A0A6A6SSA3_9PLEO|nr:hypothetical protein K491DRAFT_682785 [Lophiostoma macrostomum CBS 122681]
MALVLHIGFLLCFSGGLLLSIALAYHDAPRKSTRHDYFWGRAITALSDICQVGLSVAGIVAIVIARITKTEPYWLDAVILCTLQLFAGTTLARTLIHMSFSHWAVGLAYLYTVLTVPDIASYIKDKNTCFAYESAMLSRVAIAPFTSLIASHSVLEKHKASGSQYNRESKFVRLLVVFIVVNAVAALCQMSGAVILYSLSLANKEISTNLHQGIFLLVAAVTK